MNTILATTSRGLDELLKQEILNLCPDAEIKQSPGMLQFEGSKEDAYKLCLWSRLANRVIWILGTGKAGNAEELYKTAMDIDWQMHMESRHTLSVQFIGTNYEIKNTQFGAVRIKDAIVDQFVEEGLARPSVERKMPDFPVYARLQRDNVIIGLDMAGASLHQRSYRQETGDAPLKEHIACAMLMRSGWTENMDKPLADMMCGSGTIAIEAAFMARNIAPGIKREYWGFSKWLSHDAAYWDSLVNDAIANQIESKSEIFAADYNRRMIAIAKDNADYAGVFNDIKFSNQDATKSSPPVATPGYMVSNPPYGERLGELTALIPLFSEWGKRFKEAWKGWHVSLLSSNRDLLRVLKLRATKDYGMNNGKLECRLVNYVLSEENTVQFTEDASNHEFANRLKKNLKKMKGWINKVDTNCYRIYDADLPDYNVAIDRYGDWLVVQEYAPPKTVSEDKARKRLQEVLLYLPTVTGVSPKQIVLKVRSQQKGTKQYEKINQSGTMMEVYENGARLLVNLTDYLDTGLFLDHRNTRQKVMQLAKGKDVLNLFAYTGSVSVFAAKGGAKSVTTVDMSNTYLDWAKKNVALNKLNGPHAFVQADCTSWLSDHKGKYDLIFIDPPSFSNSKRMQSTWDVQRDHVTMLTNARNCLNDGGTLIFSNNKRGFKLDEEALQALGFSLENITQETIPEDFSRRGNIHKCWILSLSRDALSKEALSSEAL
ncbi:bifunctional 23S rRNA (guanine(2069)-N(7))-methyltransferase RlmK/23S rRNA (guanine(2445)-N(2))-methyltransferase RlmL [Alteromonas stellipolaris]|uniref:Ribosomal RNA large subunit methyltransferase K/L n=1 Tax=Alteromonas stellipolaris TaxID=233316 RepID=A0ABM5YHT1_9ALTE|nr:bifunctional 23S rRNA (guanine(2069)-N(7))-methyltransferase RlmK/23S rRNA (guanine(2445)-N(2))-methyltransferase RlmL [Alteromonas stellipolaris]ALM90557.1 23S rRNA (guanine-N-2-)-methyltransferase [Alteromonas stellipolaris LMG 21856]AMJ73620.1 23S rRNA methyltransferase [Alteromonas stellipolaris]